MTRGAIRQQRAAKDEMRHFSMVCGDDEDPEVEAEPVESGEWSWQQEPRMGAAEGESK